MSRIAETGGRTAHYLIGGAFMLVGSTVVLGVVVGLNELSAPPERKEVERVTQLEVKKQPKPKPKQTTPKRRPKPRKAPKSPPRPMLSNVSSNLSGIAFDLPGLRFEDLGDQSKDLLQTGEDVVHTSDTVDTPPQPVEEVAPQYPRRASDRGIEGAVNLSFLLDASGYVQQVRVLESKPPGEFDDSAVEAIRKFRFTPALYKGEPVSGWFRKRFIYKLARK